MPRMPSIAVFMLLATALAAVQEINTDSFPALFGTDFESFTSAPLKVSRQHFILFYLPEIENSLDVREMFHQVGEENERRNIELLKRRGITEFEEFEQHLQKTMLLTEVDCGENQKVCEYFKVAHYPIFLYINKQGKVYMYLAHVNANEIFSFVNRPEEHRVDQRILRPHEVKSALSLGLSQYSWLLKSDILMYFLVFLVAPFLFGYCVMAKPVKETLDTKQGKGKGKDKKNN